MKHFSSCKECETCKTFYEGGCLAGTGDDEYRYASPEWIDEYMEKERKVRYATCECGAIVWGGWYWKRGPEPTDALISYTNERWNYCPHCGSRLYKDGRMTPYPGEEKPYEESR